MNLEQTPLEARAARHGALADPLRLRIVDLLGMGDLSPTELQERLGISSNLLAHHLKQLEAVGLVSRHRSEADRRRTYARLNKGALAQMAPRTRVAAPRVLFVCTGNSARSQMAAALWNGASTVPAASAGTHPADRIEPGAIAAAGRHGVAVPLATPVSIAEVATPGDLIVTVCDSAHEEMADAHALHWSIPDPVRVGTDAAFDSAFEELVGRVEALTPLVAPAP